MKLALYVHDFRMEVGHSNSLIELVRNLPELSLDKIDEIEVVSHKSSPLKELFPEFKGKLIWRKVPFENLSPFLVQSIFFQVWTFFYNRFFQKKGTYKIGIGICCLDVDAISIQFIHQQWTQKGLELENKFPLRKVYKIILYHYFEFCEKYLFKKKGLKLFSPAEFLTKFLKQEYPGIEAQTIYSGVNLERFQISKLSKEELKASLLIKYEILKSLNVNEPIYLFVGAYERKGIDQALKILEARPNAQLIVVGSPSLGRKPVWPSSLKVFPISFSYELPLFYSLADVFIFPTIYEPFGLVLFEAMAMGMTIITNEFEVGASELLKNLPEIYFADNKDFQLPVVNMKTIEERLDLRMKRVSMLGDISWIKAGRRLESFLFMKQKECRKYFKE